MSAHPRDRTALRTFVLRWLAANGGHARCKEIHAALTAAGFRCHERKMTYHLNLLIGEKLLVRTGFGEYWLPDRLEKHSEKILARMPFGTTLKGRILLAMVAQRISRTADLLAHLRSRGVLKDRQALNNALSDLRREGWVESVGYGTTVPAAKTYRHVGMAPRDDRATAIAPLAVRARDPIMAYLRKHGPTRAIVLIKLFGEKPDRKQRNSVNAALTTLEDRGFVTKVGRGTLDATDKPYP
jgi:hypothetical protein